MEAEDIRYAQAKQVPDMRNGFSIHTGYGWIEIEKHEAEAFADLAESTLNNRAEPDSRLAEISAAANVAVDAHVKYMQTRNRECRIIDGDHMRPPTPALTAAREYRDAAISVLEELLFQYDGDYTEEPLMLSDVIICKGFAITTLDQSDSVKVLNISKVSYV